ncbi:MAG TPA: RNA methyltransferase [Pyrinomonadaceae bacterium]|jgi:TrmH family RNA methyltransferase
MKQPPHDNRPAHRQAFRITSRYNPLIQHARRVQAGREPGLVFVEGFRLCAEAVVAGLEVEAALYTERAEADERAASLLSTLEGAGVRAFAVSEAMLAVVADTRSPQGLVLLARRPRTGEDILAAAQDAVPLVVILHSINNPTNAGAMLRVAEAAGATGVIATAGTTDLLGPKALRGAMGAAFRLPLWLGAQFQSALAWCVARGIQTVATALTASETHTDHDWTGPRAVIMGAEAHGLHAEEISAADHHIRIPMRPPVESLNVATALAVILYEAERQRAGVSSQQSGVRSQKE